jgi:sugar O-acyltransferase (sialic acid O-acetyltransferase NeuD family)
MTQPVLILGTRTLAVEVMDLISDMPGYEVAGFVENLERQLAGTELEGRPVLWIDDLPRYTATHWGVCALSTTHRRKYVAQATALGLRLGTFVHPTAWVSARARLGEGCFVSAMAAIATHTTLGRSVFVNRGALIGHHTSIGDYCTIQPGANVAGAVTVGSDTFVGMGAVVLDRHTIGQGCIIAAGAVVTHDVPDHVQVMGVPARVVKSEIEAK